MRYPAVCLGVFTASFLIGAVLASVLTFDFESASQQHKLLDLENYQTRTTVNDTPKVRSVEKYIEPFEDYTKVGRPGKNKLVIRCFEEGDKAFAEINFYFLSNTYEWKMRISSLRIEKDPIAVCDPQINDFNNDGLGDVTFGSKTVARGANEIRTLLLYNKKNDSLDLVENSAGYPNLEYNKDLDCITAWAFHDATTTIFLKIEGDRLREFASVDTGLERVVTIVRRNGERVVLRREKMSEEDIYLRYSTYDPPRP